MYYNPPIVKLVWDTFNTAHIAAHEVTPREVEEVFASDYLMLEAKKGRFLVIGTTTSGLILAVVVALKGTGIYYPVTARRASKRERQHYQHLQGEEAA